ncbi:MAG: macrolide ABC transporter ATP-binding protein [Ectothiorhodospiraceae bacterium]|nr:macrolide ABC transporter ATP-binding protein [Ectothiorhodospiraceae bacterium]
MALIDVQNVTKVYNSTAVPVKAVSNLSMEIGKKEFTAIVGPSGSGKTTLMNMIGGLDSVTEGSIKIGEKEITGLKENDLIEYRLHHIGFVFQAYNLIPVLTAVENVEFIMVLRGYDKAERRDRAVELLKRVGLEDKLHVRPSKLSGGQQQRVAVARALAAKPEFVLADEPTANLDTASTDSLLSIMEELNEEHEMTFIFSTHDDRVIRRARRVVTLEDGMIKSDDWRNT